MFKLISHNNTLLLSSNIKENLQDIYKANALFINDNLVAINNVTSHKVRKDGLLDKIYYFIETIHIDTIIIITDNQNNVIRTIHPPKYN